MRGKIFSCLFLLLALMTAVSFGSGEARPRAEADIEGPATNPQGLDYKQLYYMILESLHHWVAGRVRMGDEEAPCRIGIF